MLSKGTNLVLVSMLVFGILNFIENLIHYNIGIDSSSNCAQVKTNSEFKFYFPHLDDFLKIIFTMIVFGLAQGLLTELFIGD